MLQTAVITKRGRKEYIVERFSGNVQYTQTGDAHWMVCIWPECVVKLRSQPLWCFRLHTAPRVASSKDRTVEHLEGGWLSLLLLVNHELLEGVEIRWDEGADRLVVVVEDLLPSALWAHRAGWPDQAGVGSAVTLVEHRQTSESLSLFLFCHRVQTQQSQLGKNLYLFLFFEKIV